MTSTNGQGYFQGLSDQAKAALDSMYFVGAALSGIPSPLTPAEQQEVRDRV